jgi:hypothetical protein
MNVATPGDASKNFYPLGYTVSINWTDGRKESSNEQYILGGKIGARGFCSYGVIPCTNIVSDESWFSVKKFGSGWNNGSW